MIKLYGSSTSGNSLKPRWTASFLNIPFEWIEIDILAGDTRKPEFLALNPAGQAPVAILNDGRILAQSNAIMLYLAEGTSLIPHDVYTRAKMMEWLFWEQYSHEPAIAVRIFQKAYLGKRDEELDPALLKKGESALARLELQAKASPFLVGEAMSLADIALVAYTRVAHKGGFDLSRYPAVSGWVRRVEKELNLAAAG
jgi:glutathione S-transferase